MCLCPVVEAALSLTDLADAVTLRFGSDVFILTIRLL